MDHIDMLDGFDAAIRDDAAKAGWSNAGADKTTARRTKSYAARDWTKFRNDLNAICRDGATAMSSGARPDNDDVMDIAERHRCLIDRWFFHCSHEMHRRLADMYEADCRFFANIDEHGAGLTLFLAAAMRANARRKGRR